jgi:hypothetical protein
MLSWHDGLNWLNRVYSRLLDTPGSDAEGSWDARETVAALIIKLLRKAPR